MCAQSGRTTTIAATPTTLATSQPRAAVADTVAKRRGALRRAGAISALPHQPSPAAYASRPAAAIGRTSPRAPSTDRAIAPRSTGSAWRASDSARSSILARSIVGQSVTSVPVTVRPSHPSAIVSEWATSSRECQGSAG